MISTLRGFPTSEVLFLIAGVVVGPFVGVAASWLRRDGPLAAIGCGVLSGIAIGEGVWGLVQVAPWTGWFSWTLTAAAGLVLLTATSVRRARTPRAHLIAAGLTAIVAAGFFVVSTAAGALSL